MSRQVNLEVVKKGKGFILRNKDTGEIRDSWQGQSLRQEPSTRKRTNQYCKD